MFTKVAKFVHKICDFSGGRPVSSFSMPPHFCPDTAFPAKRRSFPRKKPAHDLCAGFGFRTAYFSVTTVTPFSPSP